MIGAKGGVFFKTEKHSFLTMGQTFCKIKQRKRDGLHTAMQNIYIKVHDLMFSGASILFLSEDCNLHLAVNGVYFLSVLNKSKNLKRYLVVS